MDNYSVTYTAAGAEMATETVQATDKWDAMFRIQSRDANVQVVFHRITLA